MRTFFVTLASIACVIFLATGHFYWKDKTRISSHAAEEENMGVVDEVEDEPTGQEETPVVADDVLGYAANWPTEAQDGLQVALEEEQAYKIALVGSQALGGDQGWAAKLKDSLSDTYGEEVLEVKTFEYNMTSIDFINEKHDAKVVDFAPDLVLFEPFILKDNGGRVAEETNHENIGTFVGAVQKVNSDAVFILQPSYPIFRATGYPKQVDSLKEYAEANGYSYLDHWDVWPDPDTEEIYDYLIEEQAAPNEKGHEVWFEFLRDYFIAK